MRKLYHFMIKVLVMCVVSVVAIAALLFSPLADSVSLLHQGKMGVYELGYQALTQGVNAWREAIGIQPWTVAQVKKAVDDASAASTEVKRTTPGSSAQDAEKASDPAVSKEPDIPTNAPPGSALANQTILKTARTFPVLIMPYYYDPEGAPPNWPEAKMLAKIQKASEEWRAICNIQFEYKGIRGTAYGNQRYRRSDGIGAIRWETLDEDALGVGSLGDIKDGPAKGFWLKLSQDWFAVDTPTRDSLLHHVLVHELGHVVGFPHSPVKNSIMFATSDVITDEASVVPSVTENDAKYCWYLRYRWDGKSSEEASALTGIAIE